SDIQANVAGTMIAGGTSSAPSTTFNPFQDVDFANSAIFVPAGSNYHTGDRLIYNSLGGPLDGLERGGTYYAIVPPGLPNEIQLAKTLAEAQAGTFIHFAPYPTLTGLVNGNSVTVPITTVDPVTGRIEFGYNPGFTDGEVLTYTPVAGRN